MDISTLGFTAIPAITVICYLIAQFVKVKMKSIANEWLPVICGTSGALLGVVESIINPATITGGILAALAVGIVSGLAATGAHQIYSQLSK